MPKRMKKPLHGFRRDAVKFVYQEDNPILGEMLSQCLKEVKHLHPVGYLRVREKLRKRRRQRNAPCAKASLNCITEFFGEMRIKPSSRIPSVYLKIQLNRKICRVCGGQGGQGPSEKRRLPGLPRRKDDKIPSQFDAMN